MFYLSYIRQCYNAGNRGKGWRDDLASGEGRFGKKKQGFHEEQRRMLEKWQVPRKYHDMIEDLSYTKDEG